MPLENSEIETFEKKYNIPPDAEFIKRITTISTKKEAHRNKLFDKLIKEGTFEASVGQVLKGIEIKEAMLSFSKNLKELLNKIIPDKSDTLYSKAEKVINEAYEKADFGKVAIEKVKEEITAITKNIPAQQKEVRLAEEQIKELEERKNSIKQQLKEKNNELPSLETNKTQAKDALEHFKKDSPYSLKQKVIDGFIYLSNNVLQTKIITYLEIYSKKLQTLEKQVTEAQTKLDGNTRAQVILNGKNSIISQKISELQNVTFKVIVAQKELAKKEERLARLNTSLLAAKAQTLQAAEAKAQTLQTTEVKPKLSPEEVSEQSNKKKGDEPKSMWQHFQKLSPSIPSIPLFSRSLQNKNKDKTRG